MKSEDHNTEQAIIEAAREVFVEKGFAETSMADIAARVGVNRSGLHYYFRTKERLFEAVGLDLMRSFLPDIHHIILQEKPVADRVTELVEVYFNVIRRNPRIPAFAFKEIQRDPVHMLNTIGKLDIYGYMGQIRETLLRDMQEGRINSMPLEFLFYTLYGLISFPFLSRPITRLLDFPPADRFDEILDAWESQVVSQMCSLLCPK